MEIWSRIFDSAGFIPRAQCGAWTPALIRLHNVSDFFIWTAYIAIPLVLIYFVAKRRGEIPFQQMFWLFGIFIIACGTTHLMDIVLFYNPLYRLAGIVKLVTAAASWGTVFALHKIVPQALAMRSPEVLEREIKERERVEAEVRHLNASLEDRVRERTAELEAANDAKDDLLHSAEQARVEAEEARAEAVQANRLKDEFLATVSHELRTPLNAMLGWSNILHSENVDDVTRVEAVETIERSARVQMQIIDDILDVSRFVMGKFHVDMQPANLADIVDASLIAVHPAVNAKNIEVQKFDPGREILVSGDPNRLQQVIWNILSNAVKFTPKGGKILVHLRVVDSRAEIAITDTGSGIDPAFLPYVFDRFRQGDSSSTRHHGGLGLGLSIVRHIVELHGGNVRVESGGENQGATFTVSLPLLAVASATAAAVVAPEEQTVAAVLAAPDDAENENRPRTIKVKGPLSSIRILVVDDDLDARRVISKALELHGADIRTAPSAPEALRLMLGWQPDVLVSDIGMPGEDGLSLIRKVREREGGTGIHMAAIALTAYAGSEDRAKSLAAGFQTHIAKPVVPQDVVGVVNELAAGQQA